MTNQASEDELREQLADKLEWYSRYRERGQDDDMDRAFDDILALIRSEKQKLLAEVRERVIGENDRGTITDPDSPSYGEPYESAMADKDELQAELTKLEAEL